VKYWLMKSEPNTFNIDDLRKAARKTTDWEGVRNYQARNFMRDDMKKNDLAFFYHSNCEIPGIAGIVKIVRESTPDLTALDPRSPYFDPKSSSENPRWFMVSIQLIETFHSVLPLSELKAEKRLKNLALVKPGNRLSVLPVSKEEWKIILSLKPKR